jgi:hypothetical protein
MGAIGGGGGGGGGGAGAGAHAASSRGSATATTAALRNCLRRASFSTISDICFPSRLRKTVQYVNPQAIASNGKRQKVPLFQWGGTKSGFGRHRPATLKSRQSSHAAGSINEDLPFTAA